MTNTSDPHPYLVQLRKQAKELKQSRNLAKLADAQFELAKSLGYPSWPKLVLSVQQKDLHQCMVDGTPERMQAILDRTPRLARLPFDDGSSPIMVAAEYDDPNMISMLHKAGASLRDRYGRSGHEPLSWALTCASFHAARHLVELGEKPDLFCAAGLGDVELIQQFWTNGRLAASPSRTGSSRFDSDGSPLPRPPKNPADQVSDALYIACRNGHLEAARYLLDHGADPNWRGFGGATNLAWAEFSGNSELCALLREKGGDDSLTDPVFLATPRVFGILVLVAWHYPSWRLRQRLSSDSTLANVRGGHGTVLHVAIFNNNREAVEILLAAGADKSALNAEGSTPFQQAMALDRKDLAELVA